MLTKKNAALDIEQLCFGGCFNTLRTPKKTAKKAVKGTIVMVVGV